MKGRNCEVVAIASRDGDRARGVADHLGISRAHASYAALLQDPDVDAIYNPLPNHLHVELTLKAAAAGKHVLCEKPIGLSAADAERLRACPKDIIVAEAFMVRFHPQWKRVRELMRSGELGDVHMIRSVFCYYNVDPANVRNMADIGGGGILDIGCYPVTAGRFFFECEPERVVTLVDRDPEFGTDRTASAIADFGDGRQLCFMVSTQAAGTQSVELIGTRARAEIIIPFNAPADQATAITIDEGLSFDGALARREIIAPCNQYTLQAEAFSRAVLGEEDFPYSIDDAILSMKVLDALFASEKSGGWATIA